MGWETAEEYWEAAEENCDKIRSIVRAYHPQSSGKNRLPVNNTVPAVEKVLERVRKRIINANWIDPVEVFSKSLANRDALSFARVMSETWVGIPESESVRSIPGFFVLCNLCSECYLVLHD